MVWSNVPGPNIYRGAEGDNTLQRAALSGVKRNTYPSQQSTTVHVQAPLGDNPQGAAHFSSRPDNLHCRVEYLQSTQTGSLKSKSIGDNTVVRFNNNYCPELGAAMALARQEVFGSHPPAGDADLLSHRAANHITQTFVDVPRLVNTLSLLQRHAPSMPLSGPLSAPLQHFPHGFGSLRTIRPSMGSPALGWGTPQREQEEQRRHAPTHRPAAAQQACPRSQPCRESIGVQTIPIPPALGTAAKAPSEAATGPQQESIKAPPSSSLNSAVLLQQLQQQLQEQQQQQAPPAANHRGTDQVSVGCQTRQGDNWRLQSTACQGGPQDRAQAWVHHDHAWVPAGSHYMDKMSHEAATPNRPPNSPQGVQAPSSSSSPKRPQSSSSRRHGSQQKPAWDSWGFSKLPLEGSGTAPGSGKGPTRSAFKNLTASWSPTRKGFVKPEIAGSSDGFSHSYGRKASSKHAASCRQSPQQCSKIKSGKGQHADKDKACTASEGKPDMPQSFLQPILHSQHSSVLPDEGHESATQSQQFSAAQSKSGSAKKKKGSRRKAAQRAQHTVGNAEQQSRGFEQALSRVIATNLTQGQGSYVSPLQSPRRRRPQSSRSPAACNLSFVIMPGSSHDRNPAGASDSAGSAQYSPSHSSGAAGSQTDSPRAQLDTHSSATSELDRSGDGERQARPMYNREGTDQGRRQRFAADAQGNKPSVAHTHHSSRASSGLRREVQDSLSELERLIEQQHRQLVERGVLLPAEPSSGSLPESDLDFCNLSLDTSMDQLSRMADSLAEGVPPGSMSLATAALPAGSARSAGHTSCDNWGFAASQHAQHGAQHSSKHDGNRATQMQSRRSHSSAKHDKQFPSSPHACPTCYDLISEETQSQAGSCLSDLSHSGADSDPEADSDSELELLSSRAPALKGKAAADGPQPLSCATPASGLCSECSSPEASASQQQQPHLRDAGLGGFRAHMQRQAAADDVRHKDAKPDQLSDHSKQHSPRSEGDDMSMEDSSCFGSTPASMCSSPRQPNASTRPAQLSTPQHSVAQYAAQPSPQQPKATAGAQASAAQHAKQSGQSTAGKAQPGEHKRQPQTADVAAQHQLGASPKNGFTAYAPGLGLGLLQSGSEGDRQPDTDEASTACDDCHERHALTHDVRQPTADKSLPVSEDSESGSQGGDEAALADVADGGATLTSDDAEMSESEEEFERTLADARQLRPTNQLHMHVRQCEGILGQTAAAVIKIQAECTASAMQQRAEKAVFSAIFRQTPTNISAVADDEDDRGNWSECSEDLSAEPSAAHWAAAA